MKSSTLFRLVFAIAFLCLSITSIAAQDYGAGVSSYTSIDYDEETNTVTAYSETELDYSMVGSYQAYVGLTVTKSSGGIAASGSMRDYRTSGFASIELNFAGESGVTYTAVGSHRTYLDLWDYSATYPYDPFYFDDWNFSNFESLGINEPWHYLFLRPAQSFFRRRNDIISLGTTYDSASITVTGPTVTISVPQTAQDGDTVEFRVVSVQNGTPTGYQWSFEPTSGGNNPQVNFSNPTAATTTAKAHWFAKPDTPCTSLNSTYTIKVKVTFQNRSPITKKAPFTVSVGSNWGGKVLEPLTLAPGGTLDVAYDSQRELWVVTGRGRLQRVPSPIVMREIPETSQFYNKVYRHEEVHFEQYATGIYSNLFQIDNVMPRLFQLSDPNKQVLEQKIFEAVRDWRVEQSQILDQRYTQAEAEAYAVSDPIAPRYIFQGACPR